MNSTRGYRLRITMTMVSAAMLVVAVPARAVDNEISFSIYAEARWFIEDSPQADQLDGVQLSSFAELEMRRRSPDRHHQFQFAIFARADAEDDERTHIDLRQAYYRYVGADWEILAGVNRVFWGVTESRHLVNLINQIDAVEDVDEEDYLGQPMINLAFQRDWGRTDFYLMTGFRERTFSGRDGRLRPQLPVDNDRVLYEDDLEEWNPDGRRDGPPR